MSFSGQTPADRTAKAIARYVRKALREDRAPHDAIERLDDWVCSDRCDTEDEVLLCVDVLDHMQEYPQATLRAVLAYLRADGRWRFPSKDALERLKGPLLAGNWRGVEDWFCEQFPPN